MRKFQLLINLTLLTSGEADLDLHFCILEMKLEEDDGMQTPPGVQPLGCEIDFEKDSDIVTYVFWK